LKRRVPENHPYTDKSPALSLKLAARRPADSKYSVCFDKSSVAVPSGLAQFRREINL
jgi:hypothetical protein